jgi:hypothetical protein
MTPQESVNDMTSTMSMRACVVAATGDRPEDVAGLAGALPSRFPFSVTVVVCAPRPSGLRPPRFVGPEQALGLGPAMAADRQAARAQRQLADIERALHENDSSSPEAEAERITGSPYRIARRLAHDFDLLVVHGRLGPVGVMRRWWPGLPLRLAFASNAPTLFCPGPPELEQAVVVDCGDRASWAAWHVMQALGGPLRLTVEVASAEELAVEGNLPAPEAPACLVLSLPAVRRTFRKRALSAILRSWKGACLLWP